MKQCQGAEIDNEASPSGEPELGYSYAFCSGTISIKLINFRHLVTNNKRHDIILTYLIGKEVKPRNTSLFKDCLSR